MTTIYTTDTCPRCKVLKKKLEQKNIKFNEVNDIEQLRLLNIDAVPVLDIGDGKLLNFSEANNWINEQE